MANYSRLPTSLLDLVFVRANISAQVLAGGKSPWPSARRYSQAVASRVRTSTPHMDNLTQSFYAKSRKLAEQSVPKLEENVQSRQLSELEERVSALKNATAVDEASLGSPHFSEEDLLVLYEDVLQIQSSDEQAQKATGQSSEEELESEDLQTLRTTASRLLEQDTGIDARAPSLVDQLAMRRGATVSSQDISHTSVSTHVNATGSLVEAVANRLESIYIGLENFQSYISQQASIPVGIMTEKEWSALIRVSTREGATGVAERVLDLMKRAKAPIAETVLNDVLAVYAHEGDIRQTEAFLEKYVTESLSERQRDLHIKAYVKATPQSSIPTDALSVIHKYESLATPAPQQSYTRIIMHLFRSRSSVAHAHAWDLFSHMRYAAHPIPDAALYTMMIRACASPSYSGEIEPERAMDLFTEMTVEQGIRPTAGVYHAVILAFARSGKESYIHEAYRLAKQMLDAHRDARGVSEFKPSQTLFRVLLEGAKRLGDLSRVRWMLAEMVRTSQEEQQDLDEMTEPSIKVDDTIMTHVFHTYAAYKVPFIRSETRIVENEGGNEPSSTQNGDPAPNEDETRVESQSRQGSAFSQLPPQTRAEVIFEVDALFSQILNASKSGTSHNFHYVDITPKLLNAYLSVHYSKSPLRVYRELYRTLFSKVNVRKIPQTYIDALERCAMTRNGLDRVDALKFAEDVWEEWQLLETKWRNRESDSVVETITPRHVEKATVAMVRLLSNCGQPERALDLVKAFVQRYPPLDIRNAQPKHEMRSTRTVLDASRPLVRLTTPFNIVEDNVPPCLSFAEIGVLHSRFLEKNDVKAIKYLKWVCKSYEGSLRIRRDRTIKAVPRSLEGDKQGKEDHTAE